jgi:hypothetical protein
MFLSGCYEKIEEERAMGWDYYAADNIAFSFNARCRVKRSTSPLKGGNASKWSEWQTRTIARGNSWS